MSDSLFRKAWFKVVSVLVAVAMVVPLAFSGLTTTKTYADEANPDVVEDQDVPVEVIGNDFLFRSNLQLDSNVDTSGFGFNPSDNSTPSIKITKNNEPISEDEIITTDVPKGSDVTNMEGLSTIGALTTKQYKNLSGTTDGKTSRYNASTIILGGDKSVSSAWGNDYEAAKETLI